MGVVIPCGVAPTFGVMLLGVAEPKDGVELDGVSSQRERRLLADPTIDSLASGPMRSARGVSAQPLLWPGVSGIEGERVNFKEH